MVEPANRSSRWVAATQLADTAVQTIVGVALARSLGPHRQGQMVAALGFAGIVAVLVLFGTTDPALRRYIQNPEKTAHTLAAHLQVWGRGVLLLTFAVASYVTLSRLAISPALYVLCASAALAVNGLSTVAGAVIQAYGRGRRDAANVACARAVLVIVAFCAGASRSVALALLGYLLSAMLLASLRWQLVAQEIASFSSLRVAQGDTRALLSEGRAVGIGAVFGSIAGRVDIVLMQSMTSASQLGLYGACYRFLGALQALTMAAAGSTFPAFLQHRGRSNAERYTAYLRPALLLLLIPMLGVAFAASLVEATYGTQYAAAASMMRVLWFAGMVQVANVYLHKVLVAEARQRSIPIAQAVQAIVNVLCNCALIPRLGGLGAAYATLICELVVVVVHALVHRDVWMTRIAFTRFGFRQHARP